MRAARNVAWTIRSRSGRRLTNPGGHAATILITYFDPRRMHRIDSQLRHVLKCDFVERVIVSNHNPAIRIEDCCTVRDPRVRFVNQAVPRSCGYRWTIARELDADYLIVIDDDILFYPAQLASFFERLVEDPEIPHGLTGIVLHTDKHKYFAECDATVELLCEAYAVTKHHVRRYHELTAALAAHGTAGAEGAETIADFVLISATGARAPRVHDVGRILRSSTFRADDVAVHRIPGFWQVVRQVRSELIALVDGRPGLVGPLAPTASGPCYGGSTMTAGPRLTIGLCVYNGENYLEPAIDSLLAQTYRDFELLIADNASTDRTEAICRRYADVDSRVRYHRHPVNIGYTGNWYFTLDACRTEYYKWAAHDDVYAPRFLERCVALLDANPAALLAYTKATIIDSSGAFMRDFGVVVDTTSPRPHERLYNAMTIDALCIQLYGVIRSSALRSVTRYRGYFGWDRNTLADLAMLGELHEVPEPLFHHRFHRLALGAALMVNRPVTELLQQDPQIDWDRYRSAFHRARNYCVSVARWGTFPVEERARCLAVLARVGALRVVDTARRDVRRIRRAAGWA